MISDFFFFAAADKRSLWKEFKEFERMQLTAQVNGVREYRDSVHEDFSLNTEDPFDSDMEWWLRRLFKKTSWKTSHPLIKGLMRGVAAYHPHLPKPYRDLVETLFRVSIKPLIPLPSCLLFGARHQLGLGPHGARISPFPPLCWLSVNLVVLVW